MVSLRIQFGDTRFESQIELRNEVTIMKFKTYNLADDTLDPVGQLWASLTIYMSLGAGSKFVVSWTTKKKRLQQRTLSKSVVKFSEKSWSRQFRKFRFSELKPSLPGHFLEFCSGLGRESEVLPRKLRPKVGWFGSGSRFIYSNSRATAKMGSRRFVYFRVGRGKTRMVEMDL